MRKAALIMLIGLVAVSLSSVYAADLQVYNDNGQLVPKTVASAVGLKPAYDVTRAPIKITAELKGVSLGISLSATEINWTIRSPGNYMTPAIIIKGRKNSFARNLNMYVKGANDLKSGYRFAPDIGSPIAREIPTSYCLRSGTSITSLPRPNEFVPAQKFNGTHRIQGAQATLWNRLEIKSTVPTPCKDSASCRANEADWLPNIKYSDEFTVTFSALL